MDYQVWTKDEYGDIYTKVDCGDLAAARRELDKAVRAGREPILTQELPYELSIKVGEPGPGVSKARVEKQKAEKIEKEVTESEADQSEAEPDKGPGPESPSEVGPGAPEPVPE